MMQQWQQMTSQQKAMAIGLIVLIVLALAFILWFLFGGRQPQSPTTIPTAGTPTGTAPSGTAPGTPSTVTVPGATPGTASAPGVPPELAGMPSGAMPGAPMPTQSIQPPTPPSTPQPGKTRVPPKPGRGDPFAALPSQSQPERLAPFIPPRFTPPFAEEPVTEPLIARETPPERIASLPISSVPSSDFASYFSTRPQTAPTADASGWRMAGFMMTEQRITALLQLPDGKTRSVQPGSTVAFGTTTYTVTRIEPDRVTLRSEQGDELVVTRRPAQPVPTTPSFGSPSPGGTPY